jgi:hypothetical protein
MMFELDEEGMCGTSFRRTDKTPVKPGAFKHQKDHDKPAKKIEGE